MKIIIKRKGAKIIDYHYLAQITIDIWSELRHQFLYSQENDKLTLQRNYATVYGMQRSRYVLRNSSDGTF